MNCLKLCFPSNSLGYTSQLRSSFESFEVDVFGESEAVVDAEEDVVFVVTQACVDYVLVELLLDGELIDELFFDEEDFSHRHLGVFQLIVQRLLECRAGIDFLRLLAATSAGSSTSMMQGWR